MGGIGIGDLPGQAGPGVGQLDTFVPAPTPPSPPPPPPPPPVSTQIGVCVESLVLTLADPNYEVWLRNDVQITALGVQAKAEALGATGFPLQVKWGVRQDTFALLYSEMRCVIFTLNRSLRVPISGNTVAATAVSFVQPLNSGLQLTSVAGTPILLERRMGVPKATAKMQHTAGPLSPATTVVFDAVLEGPNGTGLYVAAVSTLGAPPIQVSETVIDAYPSKRVFIALPPTWTTADIVSAVNAQATVITARTPNLGAGAQGVVGAVYLNGGEIPAVRLLGYDLDESLHLILTLGVSLSRAASILDVAQVDATQTVIV